MNERQKSLLVNATVVSVVTACFVVAMYYMKDRTNKAESILAMQQLGDSIIRYRSDNRSLPPEYTIKGMTENIEGSGRLGEVIYRAMWVSYDSPPETILAYSKKRYHSFFIGPGCVVLQLDGQVKWMEKKEFEEVIKQQQSKIELEWIEKNIRQSPL